MQAGKYNYLWRKARRRAKKDKELYIQDICKEAGRHNKRPPVYKSIRRITARDAPQILVITDGQGHLITEPGGVKQRWRQYFDTP